MDFKFDDIKNNTHIYGLTDELNSIMLADLVKKNNESIILVSNSLYKAARLFDTISLYNENTLFFPMDDFIVSKAISISPDLQASRVDTLNKSFSNKKYIVVTNLMGLLRFLPDKKTWKRNIKKISKNDIFNIREMIGFFEDSGYKRQTLVSATGDLGVRGFVLDIFPMGEDNPVRFEFFGDVIEKIKYFDVNTQQSIFEIDSISIFPVSDDCQNNKSTLVDYFGSPKICFYNYNQVIGGYNLLQETVLNYNFENNIDDKHIEDLENIKNNNRIYIDTINKIKTTNDGNVRMYDSSETAYLNINTSNLEEKIRLLGQGTNKIIIALKTKKDAKKMMEDFNGLNVILTTEDNLFSNKVNIIVKQMNKGFMFRGYIYITDNDIFNRSEVKSKYKTRYKRGTKIDNISKLGIGDFIVHNTHGIGKYLGIVTLTKKGLKKDYITLMYKGGDKLYIPVEKIDLISKYASNNSNPKLSKLGGVEWKNIKNKTKTKVNNIAKELLKISAARKIIKGFSFDVDSEEQVIFENQFEYNITVDQYKATMDIKRDMESTIPMDRLICGDVGFGKTEVAFRAMFKAVFNGKQVAYVCPTTLLSNQHYESALKRFSHFAIRIELLNRFVTRGKVNQIIKDMEDGKVDIVIGTHRLFSKDIKFKNLGLLIIDEEQRFGVVHKEKIKKYKENVGILTLSATPIPRTLQMSILGLRDLSLIETPPVDRYPIQTYVIGVSNEVIKDAVYKELARKGQVFILYNKIKGIYEKANEIKKMIPEVRITIAHGQMPKHELEKETMDFVNKKYDILLCTTIIETGIDIPNVNTLIIFDADKFGLAQLYQLRGRVGRSNRIAYCYLMYDKKKVLGEEAVKRLDAIKKFTKLGSGYLLAHKDLGIRGAGDVLGSEQAGFIDAVGLNLYTKMVNEEVEKLKGIYLEEDKKEEKAIIDVETHIPDEYVDDVDLKILIHQKINTIDNYFKLLKIKEEIEDRFGQISNEMLLYMHGEWFEKLCERLKISKVKETKKEIFMYIPMDVSKKISGVDLLSDAEKESKNFSFRYIREEIVVSLDKNNLEEHYLYYLIRLLEKIIDNML